MLARSICQIDALMNASDQDRITAKLLGHRGVTMTKLNFNLKVPIGSLTDKMAQMIIESLGESIGMRSGGRYSLYRASEGIVRPASRPAKAGTPAIYGIVLPITHNPPLEPVERPIAGGVLCALTGRLGILSFGKNTCLTIGIEAANP